MPNLMTSITTIRTKIAVDVCLRNRCQSDFLTGDFNFPAFYLTSTPMLR